MPCYILLSVVADFPTFAASRAFIDAFESRLQRVEVLRCDWCRYPKFEDAYWYNWVLRSEADPGAARALIRTSFGAGWTEFEEDDEAVWNRPASVSPEGQPATWAHLQSESCLTEEHVGTLTRGPEFMESAAPFISVSTEGQVMAEHGSLDTPRCATGEDP